tara:strand:- start:4680 stop:4958 length:279 start_codon:yes stop_codon:yes gene_type:complete
MAFKGTTPSELYERYDCEGGHQRLELDLIIAAEINDRIAEATKDNKDGKSMVARRNQKREQRQLLNNNADMLKALRDANVPIVGSNDSGDAE